MTFLFICSLIPQQAAWNALAGIQLINACGLFKPMKKSLGSKRKEICSEQQQLILDTYTGFSETEICKIYPNIFFGYTKVTIEQPLTGDGAVRLIIFCCLWMTLWYSLKIV